MLLSVVFLSWHCQIYSVQLLIKNLSINNNGLNCFIIYSFFSTLQQLIKHEIVCTRFCHWIENVIHFYVWCHEFMMKYVFRNIFHQNTFPLINTKWFSCTKKILLNLIYLRSTHFSWLIILHFSTHLLPVSHISTQFISINKSYSYT